MFLAFAPLEPHFRYFFNFMLSKHVCSSIEKIKLKIAIKHCVLLYNMPTLSNAGTIIKMFYHLQVGFNKRPQYTRAKLARCTKASHFESRSQTEKTTVLPPVYKRATSFRYCTYVENWLYVCRHGEVVFSV